MTSALDSMRLLLRGVGFPVFRLVLVDLGLTCLTLVVDTCLLFAAASMYRPSLQNLCCHPTHPPLVPARLLRNQLLFFVFAPSFLSADASSFACLLGSMEWRWRVAHDLWNSRASSIKKLHFTRLAPSLGQEK